MKIINKIMIGIAVICLLLCGGILVFAMNPDMTDALAQRLYGNGNNAETVTEGVTASGNTENTDADGNIRVTLPNGTPGEMNGYVAPAITSDSGGRQQQERISTDPAGGTGSSGSGSTEPGGDTSYRRSGNRSDIFGGRISLLPDVAGGAAGGLPTDICQCYGTDGTFCSGENRDSGRCEECF